MKCKGRILTVIAAVVALSVCCTAQAGIYSFDVFTANGIYGDNPGLNLRAEVFNGDGTATFKFYNDSLFDCSVTQIFFDDGTLLGISSLENGPGTDFGTGEVTPGPGNLPSGENLTPDFVADREFSIAPFPPSSGNGIETGEWASVTFDLINGGTLQDVLDELANGELRVGIHIQSFPDGSSESALMVPEPATALTLAMGGLLIAGSRRIRKSYGL
ncbi:MAG: hypothetical protein ISR85_02075 [Kiritimatiellales bacterium]|nr:hypothetical protein [Kiritimatiellota bacterium]MBL7011702.1 hypothetical protein [Kiritimatiellales bacterium]